MLFVLDKKEKLVGVLNNKAPLSCPYYDDSHLENIVTGVNTYEFTIPANHETSGKVEVNGYIILRDLDSKMQMFQIKNIDEFANDDSYEKTVECEHVAVPELLGKPLRPTSLLSSTLKDTMNYILQGTGWTLGDCEYTDSKDFVVDDYTTVLDGLHKVLELYEAEVQYEVIFLNGKVTSKLVHILQERGQRTLKRFTYTKDLSDVRRIENSEGIVTALIGVGKGDSGGERVTLQGFTSYLPEGYTHTSDTDWIGSDEALQTYGKNGTHIFGIYMSDAPNTETLHDDTLKELQIRCKPNVKYEMKVVTLERIAGYEADKVRIGDTIVGDDYSFVPRMQVEARILELKRSYTNPEADDMTLGDYRPIKISQYASIDKLQNLISKAEEQWNTSAYKVEVYSSNGFSFKNGAISTTLTAYVYTGIKDITDTLSDSLFTWVRTSDDVSSDTVWNNSTKGKGTKILSIGTSDMLNNATFKIDVDIPI